MSAQAKPFSAVQKKARLTRVFGTPALRVRFVRGLRFRLMLSFVIFFSLLLVALGLLFRHELKKQLDGDVQTLLDDDWGAIKGWVTIENARPNWEQPDDEDETRIEAQLKQVYFIADEHGNALEYSDEYQSLGLDSRSEIERILQLPEGKTEYTIRRDAEGKPYEIKRGWMAGPHRRLRYFLAMGRSLADSQRNVAQLTRDYFLFVPALIALSSLLGWIWAGRALRPLNLVAQAALNITGSNLSLRIPQRGAGDELDRLIHSFNRMTARLSQSFEQIRRFSTDVSHELRTPLTSIRGQLEVALFTAETPEQYREAMTNALEDVERLSSIVRALLLLSEAESGQLALQKAPLDLGEVALDFVEQFQIPAQEKALRLRASILPGCVVPADRVQIERLLSNLLSNAVNRRGHRGRGSAAHFRPVLSRAQRRDQPHLRIGVGLELRLLDCRGARRPHRRRFHSRRRNAVSHSAAARGGAGRSAASRARRPTAGRAGRRAAQRVTAQLSGYARLKLRRVPADPERWPSG
jgi:signal transduction histidine kinase